MSNSNTQLTTRPDDSLGQSRGGAETNTAAMAAQARAETEARFLVAMRNPRNIDDVRTSLLHECKRPGFAERARYSLPIGGQPITGWTIRFAEAAMRAMRNIAIISPVIYEDDHKRVVRVAVVDLEANVTLASEATIEKVIERRYPRDGAQPLGTRQGARGQTLYLYPATDRDVRQMVNAEVSKEMRTHVLRMVPADILEECEAKVLATLQNRAAKDPDAERKALVDAFAGYGVKANQLATYLGHDIGGSTPAEMSELRAVYMTLKDGQASWLECLAAKTGVEGDGEEDQHADVRDKIAEAKKRLEDSKKRGKGSGRKAKGKGRPKASDSQPEQSESPAPADDGDDEPPTREPGEEG